MDNPLNQATAEAIHQVITWAKQGGQFVQNQAPDLARQYLAYVAVSAWLQVLCPLMFMAVFGSICAAGLVVLYRTPPTELTEQLIGLLTTVSGMLFIGATLVFLLVGFDGISTLLRIHYAPKIVLMDGLARMFR